MVIKLERTPAPGAAVDDPVFGAVKTVLWSAIVDCCTRYEIVYKIDNGGEPDAPFVATIMDTPRTRKALALWGILPDKEAACRR
jgi:transposase InsO family protein